MAKNKKTSVSQIADKLTKQMGKYEKQMEEGDALTKKTAKLMHEKTQAKLDKLFEHQEAQKQAEFQKATDTYMKKYGGMLYNDGGYLPSYNYGGRMKYDNGGTPPPGLGFDDWSTAHFKEFPGDVNNADFNNPEYLQEIYGDYQRQTAGMDTFPDGSSTAPSYGGTPEFTNDTEKHTITNNLRGPAIETVENIPGQEIPKSAVVDNSGFDYDSLPYANPNQPAAAQAQAPGQGNNMDTSFGNMLYKGAAYAPTAYNAFRGLQKPQVLDAERFQNPYEQRAMDLMGDRRYDINPQLEAIKRSRAGAQRNIASASGGNAATYLGNIGSAQSRSDAANAQAYATKNNFDNQYLGQEAGMLGNFGAQRARTELGIQNINDQNRAARDNYLGAAFTGMSNIAQNERMMNNQANADQMRIQAMKEMGTYFDPEFTRNGRQQTFQGYNYKG